MTTQPQWTFDDGWILMSVYLTQGQEGASLSDVIGAADAMNHAIPTAAELTIALTRLMQCRIVERVDGRFRIATDFVPEIAAAFDAKGGLFATPDKGKRWLVSTAFDMDDEAGITVSEADADAAYDEYVAALRRDS